MAGGPVSRGPLGRWWATPRVRRIVARVGVVIGALLVVFSILTGRWGLLVAGIIVVGFAAAAGPARIKR